jgi:TPR repeat protein
MNWTNQLGGKLTALTFVTLSCLIVSAQQTAVLNLDSIGELRAKAESGNAAAQYNVGIMYDDGAGVIKDEVEAARWFRKAATQGDAKSQLCLGHKYRTGHGVLKDSAEAVKWYRKAAEQGLGEAQYFLGLSYSIGEGVPKDKRIAYEWNYKAAKQGLANAQFLLGAAYTVGEGVSENPVKALKWYRMAAEQGHSDAQRILGFYYKDGNRPNNDPAQEIQSLQEAFAQRNANPIAPDLTTVHVIGRDDLTNASVKKVLPDGLLFLSSQGLVKTSFDQLDPKFQAYYGEAARLAAVQANQYQQMESEALPSKADAAPPAPQAFAQSVPNRTNGVRQEVADDAKAKEEANIAELENKADEIKKAVSDHTLLIGMTMDQVREAFGSPANFSNSIYKLHTSANWIYPGRGKDIHGNACNRVLKFEDGILAGWSDTDLDWSVKL